MLRLNKATSIVAPTLAIKQQWKDRFLELFLMDKQQDWISMDIKNPKFIELATYQSLHNIYKDMIISKKTMMSKSMILNYKKRDQ